MPLEIHAEDSIVEIEPSDLVDRRGVPTMEAEAVAGFLRTVDFTPLFDNPQIQQFVETEMSGLPFEGTDAHTTAKSPYGKYFIEKTPKGSYAVGFQKTGKSREHLGMESTGAKAHNRALRHHDELKSVGGNYDNAKKESSDSISGEDAVQFIDERDLLAMFKLHLREEYPRDTLSERTVLSLFSDLMEGSDNSQDARRMAMIQEVVKRARFRKRRYAGLPSNNKGVTQWRESDEEVDVIDFPGFETVNEAWPTGRNYKTRKNVKKRVGLRSTVSANAWRESDEGMAEGRKAQFDGSVGGGVQHHKFHDGGFVLHKVKVGGNHYSAWFSKDGQLKDAEPGHGARVRHVGSNVRTELARMGQRYVGRQESTQSQSHAEGASLASQLCESMAKK